jgi:hypothetical protein
MQAASAVAVESERTVRAWIEERDGSIARGSAVAVTSGGARVRLDAKPGFDSGHEVSLRLCFQPGAPSVAMSARVAWVRAAGATNECGLEWTASAEQRAALAPWLAA